MNESSERLTTALGDRFVVEGVLQSGLIVTWPAEQRDPQRSVFLKALRADLAITIDTQRFLEQMETARRLRHPHILPILELGTAAGSILWVSPRPDGETLRERLRSEARLAVDDALRIARDAARGLNHGHEQGLRHGFIRPESLFVTARGTALTDFGVLPAALESKRAGPDLPQELASYASPEQADPYAQPGAPSDLYSLGCVLFEMLSGQPPYRGTTATILMSQHKGAPIPDLTRLRPDVPPGVRAILQSALAKEPHHRVASGAAFALSLEEEMASRPDLPLPPELASQVGRASRRSGCRHTAVLVLVFIGIIAAALATKLLV